MTDPMSRSRSTLVLERLEGLTLFVAAIIAYWQLGASWWLFAALLLVPDISMLGYLRGPRWGSITYNAVHVVVGPLVTIIAGLLLTLPLVTAIGVIWLAHIGMDRAAGYGLKLPTGFKDTTMGRL